MKGYPMPADNEWTQEEFNIYVRHWQSVMTYRQAAAIAHVNGLNLQEALDKA